MVTLSRPGSIVATALVGAGCAHVATLATLEAKRTTALAAILVEGRHAASDGVGAAAPLAAGRRAATATAALALALGRAALLPAAVAASHAEGNLGGHHDREEAARHARVAHGLARL
eukprot:12140446-Alexandrium_andersonii.AAC.1